VTCLVKRSATGGEDTIRSCSAFTDTLIFLHGSCRAPILLEWEKVDELPALIHLSRRLFVAGSVRWIVRGLDLRESFHAVGVNLGNSVLEVCALHFVLDFAIPEGAFKRDELPLLESFGELRETPPGIDAMPFGAGFVIAFVVLPTFLGCDVEDDVLAVVLSGFGFWWSLRARRGRWRDISGHRPTSRYSTKTYRYRSLVKGTTFHNRRMLTRAERPAVCCLRLG
jgi:hypothetical protein